MTFATRLLPESSADPPSGWAADPTAGAHGGPNTALACATTPTLADLGALYGGPGLLLTVREAAEQLGVCDATVYRLCESGDLRHLRIVHSIRIRRQDLAGFLASRLQEVEQHAAPPARAPNA